MKADFNSQLAQWIAIPSISAKPENKPDCAQAAQYLAGFLKSAGLKVSLPRAGGNPVVFAQHSAPKGAPHIVIYGHYDVQPAEPLNKWKTPPFKMTVKKGIGYARGVADDKGPCFALLNGMVDALKTNPDLPIRITTLIEGEEESGSGTLGAVLKKIRAKIGKVDAVVISDTESESAQQLTITTGVRGMVAFDLTIKALDRDLHSGSGGPVPNAVRELTRVVGGLFDPDGCVNIPHFYDGVIDPPKVELSTMRKLLNKKDFACRIGAKGFYKMAGRDPFVANRFWPSLEPNGIFGGYEGTGSKTIIPATATVKITCRVAPGQDARALFSAVTSEIERRVDTKLFDLGIEVIEPGAPAYNTALPHKTKGSPDSIFKRAFEVLERSTKAVTGKELLYLRDGASIPIVSTIQSQLGADAIMLGLATRESQMHSPNENVPMKLLENGRKVWKSFFLNLK